MKENPLEGKKRSNSLNSPMASTPLEYEHGTRCQKTDYRSLGININLGSCSIKKKKNEKRKRIASVTFSDYFRESNVQLEAKTNLQK